ncbi:MAG: methionine--tRNA ligase [Deltaproteobacteria bacterium]|jgi:methionyl-tRNA synthetase|nr:methionine--tRNA ligase [Deltaproteobacteria bacterium]
MTYYVTTPIYYVNAKPHLGHAYTTIVCDTLTRYHRLKGDDSRMLTGTDEHGDKIAIAAAKEGCSPQVYADYISSHYKFAWPKFDIAYDDFIRTTEPRHKETVARFMDRVNDNGDIYFGEYGGLYCLGCERFYSERELVDGLCPDHKVAPTYVSEKNYFFKMKNYQDWLIDHIKKNPDFIRPERYKNEVLSFLSEPLEDLCISRPKSRLTWGIEIPFDRDYVTYVWFDALINYVTGLGWPDGDKFERYWPNAEHCVAKDILKPHAIFWPTMLKSAGLPIYKHLNVHGYWQLDEAKMSKSLGNVVDIFDLREEFGTSALRYFLMREMTFGLDSEFSRARIFERHNADLANDFGNLWQRSATMLSKYSGGTISAAALKTLKEDAAWEGSLAALIRDYKDHFDNMRPGEALKRVWDFIRTLNKFIDTKAPWVLARSPETRAELDLVLATLLKGLALIGILVYPVMPGTSLELLKRLGLDSGSLVLDSDALTEALGRGQTVVTGTAFFARALKPGEKEPAGEAPPAKDKAPEKAAEKAPEKTVEGTPEFATYADFKKLDLRIALVLDAEPVKKSDKLVKLKLKLGDDEERTVVAGIGNHFKVEELKGQSLAIVMNLEPRKLMGTESRGMVLCASGNDTLAFLAPNRPMPPGSPIT